MRDHQQCDLMFPTGVSNEMQDEILVGRIHVRCRFIRQQQSRAVGQGPGHRHALLFSDGQASGPVMATVLQTHSFQQRFGKRPIRPAPRKCHSQKHVLQRRQSGQQIERLENETDLFCTKSIPHDFRQAGNVRSADDHASGMGRENSRHHVQKRGFSAATGSHQGGLFPLAQFVPFNVQHRKDRAVRIPVCPANILQQQ